MYNEYTAVTITPGRTEGMGGQKDSETIYNTSL